MTQQSYEEFLAEKVRLGREDILAEKGEDWEQVNQEIKVRIAQKQDEISRFEREVIYG